MDIALYVHIPFCLRKCAYCDFASYPGMLAHAQAYLEALSLELNAQAGRFTACRVKTVFIGGGTPTLLSGMQVRRLLEGVRACFPVAADAEITMEGNPGTVTAENLTAYREAGVNRLSLGMQAAQDGLLETLGRIHRLRDVEEAVRLAHAAGFDNLNVDLIYGLPGQTPDDWRETLETALLLSPQHLSCYALIVEEGTRLALDLQEGRLSPLPDEEAERAMYTASIDAAKAAGLLQYELSNFARPGFECRHNLAYWECEPYLGIGCAAHSYMEERRFGNTDHVGAYIAALRAGKSPQTTCEALTPQDRIFERAMLGLRLTRGMDETRFARDFGVVPDAVWGEKLKRLIDGGLLTRHENFLRLTRRGMDVQNAVLIGLMDFETPKSGF